MKGFVSSYVLDTEIGRKIAGLKGLNIGWHFPTYLLQYVRNPGPLLLFDEIVIDDDAAVWAVNHIKRAKRGLNDYEFRVVSAMQPTDSEIQVFQQLVESKLFVKKRAVKMITDADFDHIKQGYHGDVSSKAFEDSLVTMKKRYGEHYARPDPERFEAMNINVTATLLEKLAARPLDDILRVPLYEYKAAQGFSLRMGETATAYTLIDQARQVLFLPSEPIRDIDEFLALYGDPAITSFRRKVNQLSSKKTKDQEIRRQISEANIELKNLEISSWNIAIGFFGLMGGLTALLAGCFASGNFVSLSYLSGSFGFGTGLLSLGKTLSKIGKTPRFDWLKTMKGLCETDE